MSETEWVKHRAAALRYGAHARNVHAPRRELPLARVNWHYTVALDGVSVADVPIGKFHIGAGKDSAVAGGTHERAHAVAVLKQQRDERPANGSSRSGDERDRASDAGITWVSTGHLTTL